jgi:eukaryotic-like serine/threonine-protein kinase
MSKVAASIGKYEVLRLLGSGAMGTVYEARDPVLERRVAVKVLAPELARQHDLRERFLREAQAAGRLRHPNIVQVYDVGESNGRQFLAMEFVGGSDLERVIQDVPLSIEWKLDLLRQLCEGLGHAHAHGVVHRDVKPANIRVTPTGDVKIMDFGVAQLQSATGLTKRGLVLGSVHYISPEQVEGKPVDARSDIFSVGAIAFELLSGKRPFDAESVTAVMARVAYGSADLDQLPRTPYSPGLEAIVMNALAHRPQDRYQSLEDMRAELQRLVREFADKPK